MQVMVVAIHVEVGEHVFTGQGLFEVETAKISLLIDSPVQGTVSQISVNLHDTVALGTTVMTIDAD
jgi:pyruvate/2-oxoglutarate dehydrogenase complex dihydrolipoamide acyltransferase (E2) component